MSDATPAPTRAATVTEAMGLVEMAWGLIANAGEGDWTREHPEWQEAAVRWRTRYHTLLASERASRMASGAAAPRRDEGAMDDLPISATGPDPDAESDPSLTDEAWESMRREMHEMHEQESAEPPRDGAAGLLASPDVLFLRELAAHIEQHEEPTLGNWRRTRDRLNKIADLLAKSEAARREAEAERDRYEHFWAMAECERVQRAVERDEARAALATAEVLIDRYARHDCQQFMRCDCGLSAALRMWKSKLAAARPAGAEGATP